MRKISFLLLLFVCAGLSDVKAQCAMCRSQLENNVSNGEELAVAEGINSGILYILAFPYILVAVVGILWYRKYRQHVK